MSKKINKLKNLYFASCPTGLEQVLLNEINTLGIDQTLRVKGGVHFECLPIKALEVILTSRVASRVFRKAYDFEIKTEKDLYHFAKEIKWKGLFALEQSFRISAIQNKSSDGSKRSKFKSPMFLAQNLKDAIVDRFRDDCRGQRPSVDKDEADIHLLLHLEPNNNPHSQKETATILVDLCGIPLHQRGYRDTNFSAPLKENLAAGLVLLSGYTGKEHLVDPMCGSSTIIIESLLIKGNIAPSYLGMAEIIEDKCEDYWDFMKHSWFTKDKYLKEDFNKLIREYYEKVKTGFKSLENHPSRTIACDHEKYAINASKFNLKASALLSFVELKQADAREVSFPEIENGILITNPPYGERIGEEEELPKLYYEFGENLKNNFKGFNAYIFTGNLLLIKKISLRTSRKDILFNGSIESRLVEYKLY